MAYVLCFLWGIAVGVVGMLMAAWASVGFVDESDEIIGRMGSADGDDDEEWEKKE